MAGFGTDFVHSAIRIGSYIYFGIDQTFEWFIGIVKVVI